jgi:hypothetical protein
MKKISLSGLADFMTSKPANQRKILRNYKYPQEDEPRVKALYYREARDRIAAFHGGQKEATWLKDEAAAIVMLAASSQGMTRSRLYNNARAIRGYYANFSDRDYEILPEVKFVYESGDVTIRVVPDLHVREQGREKVIRFHFGAQEPDPEHIKVICQVLFEVALNNGLIQASRDALLLDVTRGDEYRGARMGARMLRDIEAACETISDIWERI